MNKSNCIHCQKKQKTWPKGSSPIECAFKNGIFNPNNWNCGTLDLLRSKSDRFNTTFVGDYNFCLLPVQIVESDGSETSFVIYMSWYKSKGKTDELYILGEEGKKPRKLTKQKLEKILKQNELKW